MVLGFIVVNFMDGNGGVDDRGLDGLLLYNGLDRFVDIFWVISLSQNRRKSISTDSRW